MEDMNVLDDNTLADKVKINLNMLGAERGWWRGRRR
jgi:hypothetical protein